MRRPPFFLVPLLALAALLLAPRPARACTEHSASATPSLAAAAPAPAPSHARSTDARTGAPAECCAGTGACDAPTPCCIAPPGAVPPALAPSPAAAPSVVVRQRPAMAVGFHAPIGGAVAPEPPPPRG